MTKIVTVFRSRVRKETLSDYVPLATRMSELATKMPGYLSHKGFVADDGERVTIVEFESEEAHRAWAQHAEHVEAKKKGRSTFYAEYKIQICVVQRESEFKRK
jgi:heme-degrading monooxygenase HmoA